MPRYNVPEGMLRAFEEVWFTAGTTRKQGLEAVLEWQAHNPPRITLEIKNKSLSYCDGQDWPELRYPFVVAYLAKPQTPEEKVTEILKKYDAFRGNLALPAEIVTALKENQ